MTEPLPKPAKHFYSFGTFRLYVVERELFRGGAPVALPPKTFDALLALVGRQGHVMEKDELMKALWPDTFVEEDNLVQQISHLRKVLGERPGGGPYVETVARRGYRFAAPVGESWEESEATGRRRVFVLSWTVAALLLAAIGAATLLTLNVAGLRDRLLPEPTAPRIASIAVLPLQNLSRDPEQEYFADGMTDALIMGLGKIGALRVISRQSIMRYKGSKRPLPEIAGELNVDAVVEGTVQRSGDRVRITAQLLHGRTDRHLWAESYERDFRDVLKLQSEVAQAITHEIKIAVTPEEQMRLGSERQVDPEAYRLYLQGRYQFSKRTVPAFEKSIQLFRQALEKDPDNALAYAGLAESYGILPFYIGATPKVVFPQARAAAQKALEIDGSLAEAHAALGFVLLWHDWDWPAAERELKHAIKLKPSYAIGHHWYAEYLSAMGRHEGAISEIRRAQELDPVSALMQTIGAEILYYARRYDDAIEQARKGLFLDPNYGLAYVWLARAHEQKGMYEKAVKEYEEAERLTGRDSSASRACVFAMAGKRSKALSLVDQTLRRQRRGEIRSLQVARAYVGVGEKDRALDWLEKTYAECDPNMVFLKVSPMWDPLRDTPRFRDLLRRMSFPP
jgi:TolB-like protein/DNA-binding winged helix-turn-helix (wHTH) protein